MPKTRSLIWSNHNRPNEMQKLDNTASGIELFEVESYRYWIPPEV